jgi:hypothetical protein
MIWAFIEGVKRMGTEGTQQSRYATFDALIPGCNWEILKPYDEPIKAGIRAEQARLSGKRWLVAARVQSMSWDMIHKEILLDAALDDPDQAWERAQQWQQQLLAERFAANGGVYSELRPAEWPGPSKDAIAGGPIRRLPQGGVYREYWDFAEIDVAVLPLDPVTPISNAWLCIVDGDSELQGYFRKIDESHGFGVRPLHRIPEPSVTTAAPPKPSRSFNPRSSRWVLYLVGAALGSALYSIFR